MKKLINSLGTKLVVHPVIYYILNFTWGLLLTLVGFLLMFILLPFGRVKRYGYTLYLELRKDYGAGFSIGTVFFTSSHPGRSLKEHEFGHTVQNAILGPFTLLLVSVPSMLRYWYRQFLYSHGKYPKREYDSVWFEGTATSIGHSYSVYVCNSTKK